MNLGRAYEAKRQWTAAIREFELALRAKAELPACKAGSGPGSGQFN